MDSNGDLYPDTLLPRDSTQFIYVGAKDQLLTKTLEEFYTQGAGRSAFPVLAARYGLPGADTVQPAAAGPVDGVGHRSRRRGGAECRRPCR